MYDQSFHRGGQGGGVVDGIGRGGGGFSKRCSSGVGGGYEGGE